MTAEQQVVVDIRAEIDALSPDQRANVYKYAGILRQVINDHGALAMMVFALVGAELAASDATK